MKRIIFILLFLPVFVQAQTGVKWDRYFFTGSMKFGAGLHGTANATYAAQDSDSYSDPSAWLEIGNDTSKRGLLIARVLRRDSVSSPKKGLIVYEHVTSHFIGYNGSAWVVLDSAGGGSGSAYDTAYLYTVLASKQAKSDTGTYDATRYWVGQNYQPIGSYLTSEADPLSPHFSDSTVKYVTPAQLAAFNYLTSYTETDPLSAHLSDSLTKWVTYKQLYDSMAAELERLVDTAYEIRLDFPTGGGEDLDATLAIGNEGTNKNININTTSGTHGYHLSNSGFDYAHLEVTAAGTQLHQFDGDRESIITEDSLNIIDNGTGKYSSLMPGYVKADTFKVFSGMGTNRLYSTSSVSYDNPVPERAGRLATIPDIADSMSVARDSFAAIRADMTGGSTVNTKMRTYKVNVNGKVTGDNFMFTTESSKGYFFVVKMLAFATSIVSPSSNNVVFNAGFTPPNYGDLHSAATVLYTQPIGWISSGNSNAVFAVPPSTDVYHRVTVANTGTTFDYTYYIMGFYADETE